MVGLKLDSSLRKQLRIFDETAAIWEGGVSGCLEKVSFLIFDRYADIEQNPKQMVERLSCPLSLLGGSRYSAALGATERRFVRSFEFRMDFGRSFFALSSNTSSHPLLNTSDGDSSATNGTMIPRFLRFNRYRSAVFLFFVFDPAAAFLGLRGTSWVVANIQSTSQPIHAAPLYFNDIVFDELAEQVQEQVTIPFAPAPIVTYCLKQILEKMGHDLKPETLNKIHELMEAEDTPSQLDDLPEQEIQKIADQVSQELFEKSVIHLPMLTPEQEHTMLQQILRVVFQVLTTSETERRTSWLSTNLLDVGQILLLASPERRRQLAVKVNDIVDIPLLDENQEEKLLILAVERVAEALHELFPPALLRNLQGESLQGLSEMKEYLIESVNAKVDLIGFTEEQEAAMIRTMIDLLIDVYAGDTDAAMLLTSPMDEKDTLRQELANLDWEIQASHARFQREQMALQQRRNRLQAMLEDCSG